MRKLLLCLLMLVGIVPSSQQINAQISWVQSAGTGPISTRSTSQNAQLTVWNGKLYFWARDTATSTELWSYDEVTPPKMVYDLYPGVGFGNGAGAGNGSGKMAGFKNKLYSMGTTGTSGLELFAYNGTPPQVQVSSIWPGGSSGPYDLVAFGGKLYFGAQRSTTGTSTTDIDLYSYDGINPPYRYNIAGSATGVKGCLPGGMTPFGNKLYFAGKVPSGKLALYALDTTTNSPSVVTTGAPAGDFNGVQNLTLVGNKLYFIAGESGNGSEIWSYDGTTLKRVTDVAPGVSGGANNGFGYYKGEIYFSGSTDGIKFQLYKLTADGSAVLVHTINPTASAFPNSFFVYKNNLYFVAKTAATGFELWKYNGTTCAMVTDLNPGTGDFLNGGFDYAFYNGHLYFRGNNGVHVDELFRLNDPTEIQSVNWNGEVLLYPNPVTTSATLSIKLQSQQSLLVTLTDVGGKVVYSSTRSFSAGKNEVMLPMQNLAAGQYFYRISGNNKATLATGAITKQ